MTHARYLGDAVYAHFDGFNIVLTTDHHDPALAGNIIALEPTVMTALEQYKNQLKASLEAGETNRKEL